MVEVVRPEVDEWERVRTLRLAALADTPDAFGSTLEQELEQPASFWQERMRNPAAIHLIVRVDDADAGLAVVAPARDPQNSAALYGVWVMPPARGRGAGDALVRAALAAATGAGYTRLILWVGDHNPPAIALYSRHGFEPTGNHATMAPPREHLREQELAREL